MNVHPDCQSGAPRCQPKGRLLLRRQRSASEIDSSGGQQRIMAAAANQFAGVEEEQADSECPVPINYFEGGL